MSAIITRSSLAPVRPITPWLWSQSWREVLFLHWPAPESWLRQQVPGGLEIDTYEGQAWVSFVGFRLHVRLRNVPSIPWCSNCVELNFRTYVRHRNETGIYFISMHADSRLIVAAARCCTPLPYQFARFTYDTHPESARLQCVGQSGTLPVLEAAAARHGVSQVAAPESLDDFLLERYVAYTESRGRLYRIYVQHDPWQTQAVEAHHVQHARSVIGERPVLGHFSAGVHALLWPLQSISGDQSGN